MRLTLTGENLMHLPLPFKQSFAQGARALGRLPGMRLVSAPWRGNPVIVGYHRILPREAWLRYPCLHADLAVTPERFREHMAYWARTASCVSMDAVAVGTLPNRAVAVGFDDFYSDVACYALPVLEKYNIPAILYLCTDFVEGDPFLWWYGVDAAVNSGKASLDVRFEEWHFFGSLKYAWQRQNMFRRLSACCSRLDAPRQRAFLDCLGTTAHCRQPGILPTWELVEKLARHPCITIGAHTLSHGALCSLSPEESRRQMEQSRLHIEKHLDMPVHHLAYPFGGHDAAAQREYVLAAQSGFRTAVTTERGTNSPDTPLQALHRSIILQEHNTTVLEALNSGWDTVLRAARRKLAGQ